VDIEASCMLMKAIDGYDEIEIQCPHQEYDLNVEELCPEINWHMARTQYLL